VLACGFHYGSWRYVPADLSRMGIPTTFAVDTRLLDDGEWAGERPDFGGRLSVAGIDDPASLVALVRALRAGGAAYLNVDAHRGWGAGHGEASFCEVRFLGLTLRVMTGVARIAAANGAALLPVIALPDGPRPGRALCGPPVVPTPGAAADPEFVPRTMQAIFDFFAPHVAADPSEWQDVRFLHRWRAAAPAPGADGAGLSGTALGVVLASGGTLRLDGARCVRLGEGPTATLVDARTLRGMAAPEWAAELLDALEEPGGVSEAWLRERCPAPGERSRAGDLLAALAARGLVKPSTS
jgi:hypothetical protein